MHVAENTRDAILEVPVEGFGVPMLTLPSATRCDARPVTATRGLSRAQPLLLPNHQPPPPARRTAAISSSRQCATLTSSVSEPRTVRRRNRREHRRITSEGPARKAGQASWRWALPAPENFPRRPGHRKTAASNQAAARSPPLLFPSSRSSLSCLPSPYFDTTVDRFTQVTTHSTDPDHPPLAQL